MKGKTPWRWAPLLVALSFLLPNLLGFLVFTAWPVLAAFALSFCSWDLLTPPRFVGLANFCDLLGFHPEAGHWRANDPDFWKYLSNTLFLLLALPVRMAGALALAMALNRRLKGVYFYRLAFFLPSVLAGVSIYYLWRWMYNPDYGLINALLRHAGIRGPNWLSDPAWAKPALMAMGFWLAVGGTNMILYLAALQGVPADLHEAASLDGASAWQRFVHVTWPGVAPVTFFIFTMGLIHGLQSGFESAYIMTGGGPFGATTTIGYYIYNRAYVDFEMGYASAIALVLFFLTLAVTALNWRHARHAS